MWQSTLLADSLSTELWVTPVFDLAPLFFSERAEMSIGALVWYLWSLVDLFSIAVLLVVYWSTKCLMWHGFFSRKKLPPGFFGFPIINVVPYFYLGKEPVFERLANLSNKYGPLVRYRLGKDTVNVVVGSKAVREGMINDDLLGRPKRTLGDKELDDLFVKKSIVNIEGDLWRKHRRFSLMALRDLGFGKTPVMEQRIQEEIRNLVNLIDKENGQPFDIQPALVESTANNIISLVFGRKFETEKERKKQTLRMMNAITEENGKLFAATFIPFALKIMFKLRIGVMKRIMDVTKDFVDFLNEDIEIHKKDLGEDNPGDYLDHYLIAQEKDEDFTAELALGNAMAFFIAGSSTVRVTVEYLIHLMAEYPDIQRKVQAEIDDVIGQNRDIAWSDSKELVYTMAVIAERHRYYTASPAGVPRKVLKPTKLCGFDLDVNDQVIFSIDSVHHDPEIFESPHEFRPERFIDEDGKLVNTEKVWAFSIGKRACPGESLAVLEVFLYFATLLQNFEVQADGPVKFQPLRSFGAETIPQKLRFIRRT